MPGGINVAQQKERILSLIKMKGPSLPVQIARGVGVSPLFAGAFLSELYADKKVRISNMRVGSSPLYYLEGQEALLESFIEYLNVREQEAFLLLKKEGILDDAIQTPVIRVALRAIKDFAIPINVKMNDEVRLFWRFLILQEDEIRRFMKKKFTIGEESEKEVEREKKIEKPIIQQVAEIGLVAEQKSEVFEEKKEIVNEIEENLAVKERVGEIQVKDKKKDTKKAKKKKVEDNAFTKKIKEYLSTRDIEVLESILEKKKEFVGKIRIDMAFGKQEFFLVAKDKKIISDNDLAVALQNAQSVRMPALVISSGEINKKAQEYLREWRNLVKFERVKI